MFLGKEEPDGQIRVEQYDCFNCARRERYLGFLPNLYTEDEQDKLEQVMKETEEKFKCEKRISK